MLPTTYHRSRLSEMSQLLLIAGPLDPQIPHAQGRCDEYTTGCGSQSADALVDPSLGDADQRPRLWMICLLARLNKAIEKAQIDG
ncbi:hypothetical protein TWF696_002576 [Orbilia brochopaga]|uniref:Uncharacterized protein n=1 Tax=Orbilia brochopaga TaxID=3140254 RepID=A0AAV9U349_9PEZI